MTIHNEEIWRRKELAFLGRVMTDFSDKLRDQLVTVTDAAGRLKILVESSSHGLEEDRDRFSDIVSTVEKNILALSEKNQHLYRMAQRLDAPSSVFSPGEIVDEAVTLSIRAARLRRVTLNAEKAEALPELHGDPVPVCFLVLLLINDMLRQVDIGGKIAVRVGSKEKGIVIEVKGKGGLEAGAPPPEEKNRYWPLAQQLAADIGGRLERTDIDHGNRLTSFVLTDDAVPPEAKPAAPA